MTATITLPQAAATTWDAVVIGAGPAGGIAAREIARAGLHVLLVDKATFPRWKVCGCCLNGLALSTLATVGLEHVVKRCGAVTLDQVKLGTNNRTADLGLPGGVALSREAFDVAMIREAIACGVAFLPGVMAKFDANQRLTLQDASDRQGLTTVVSSRVHVAADGLNGQLMTGPKQGSDVDPRSRIGAGVMANHAPDFYTPGTIYMATARGGYVGLVRVEDGRLDVAAAFDPGFVRDAGGLGFAASKVLGQSGFASILNLESLPWRGTPALTRTSRTIAGPAWFAVGDSAGYVEPFTGEGMAWALTSGVAVAPFVARSVNGWSPQLATEWEAKHARLIRSRQTVCRVVSRVLRSPLLCRLAVRGLALAPMLSAPIVHALNRPASRAPS